MSLNIFHTTIKFMGKVPWIPPPPDFTNSTALFMFYQTMLRCFRLKLSDTFTTYSHNISIYQNIYINIECSDIQGTRFSQQPVYITSWFRFILSTACNRPRIFSWNTSPMAVIPDKCHTANIQSINLYEMSESHKNYGKLEKLLQQFALIPAKIRKAAFFICYL